MDRATGILAYWCHSCQSRTSRSGSSSVECSRCYSELIEEIETNAMHPSSFQPENPFNPQADLFRNAAHSLRDMIGRSAFPLSGPSQQYSFLNVMGGPLTQQRQPSEDELRSLEAMNVSEGECSICCDAFENTLAVKLPCEHYFHQNCVNDWLRVKPTCPTCRAALRR